MLVEYGYRIVWWSSSLDKNVGDLEFENRDLKPLNHTKTVLKTLFLWLSQART